MKSSKPILLRQLILEYDEDLLNKKVRYQDKKTGKQHTIKVASALTYDKQHPAYRAAMQLTKGKDKDEIEKEKKSKQSVDTVATQQRQNAKGDAKKQEPKKGQSDSGKGVADKEAEKEKQQRTAKMFATSAHDQEKSKKSDEHGDASHERSNLSRTERVTIAAFDIAVKALHVPGLELVAGQTEKHANTLKSIIKTHEEASTFLGKIKTVSKNAMSRIKSAGKQAMVDFSNSIRDENTGHRKSLGKIIKDKGMAVCTGVYDGIKDEFKHIKHGLQDGVDVAKKVLTQGAKSIDEADKDKITNCVRSVANIAVIGLAVSTAFPLGMTLKAAALGIHPGHALRGLITADVYSELQRRGLLNVIRESRLVDHAVYIERIQRIVEENVESIDDTKLLRFLLLEGANELENSNPLKDYSESDMDKYAEYGSYMSDLIAARDDSDMQDAVAKVSKQ